MSKPNPATADLPRAVLDGTFSGTGQSGTFTPYGPFNISLKGVGTVRPERSFDAGVTWYPIARDVTGALASWSVDATGVSLEASECEMGVLWRLNCTAYTSTITYRVSQ